MARVPHEKLTVKWLPHGDEFTLDLPWMCMEVEVMEEDKHWINEAVEKLHTDSNNASVQRFLDYFRDYPVSYFAPRRYKDFENLDLQLPSVTIGNGCETPEQFLRLLAPDFYQTFKESLPKTWAWDYDVILNRAKIDGVDLYDPMAFISYLIHYRLNWENTSWVGNDGLGQLLENLRTNDEAQFFKTIGFITKQSWFVTKNACRCMESALISFSKAEAFLHNYIGDEMGHHRFMEQVFEDLDLETDDFPIDDTTRFLMEAFETVAKTSPLAFSAMINIFEAAYYEGQDPISCVIKRSTKPHAARGYDLHYKVNQEHRHCDVPLHLAAYIAPQPKEHLMFTLHLFEITLHLLDIMEQGLLKKARI